MKRSFLIIALLIFLLSMNPAYSMNYSGKIVSLEFSPSTPKLLEQLTLKIKIKDTCNLPTAYSLDILITKDGLVKYQNEITFSLNSNSEIILSPNYVPDDIGNYDVIIRLSDKYKTHLFDSKISSFNVISDYGPFDFYLDVPTYTVEPRSKLPLLINLANRGTKGTDIKVDISLECFNSPSINQSFVYYFSPNTSTQKLVYIPVCDETGMHTLTGSISVLGKVLVTSSAQININHTTNKLQLTFPESFGVSQNQTKSFAVMVKNIGYSDVKNVKFFIGNIPKEWTQITPEKIDILKPNQSAYFIIKISVPSDADAMVYPITLTASGENTVINEQSKLSVMQGAFVKPEHPISLIQTLDTYKYYMVTGLVLLLVVIGFIKFKRKRRYDRTSVLRKIKSSLT